MGKNQIWMAVPSTGGGSLLHIHRRFQERQQGWLCNSHHKRSLELHAIKTAISFINEYSISNAKIITDSRSALHAVNNPNNNSPSILPLKELLKNTPSTVELIWTRAHIGVAGNELANICAK
ncbi:hypothetical protein CDAR_459081 [Caerostris darwini]|uniref:RNase H type-1 domain-containing protein n=1 Tax=Caerostris darwini TaxID=1538125 RepID=A0AAV4SWH6_9ARAC|nr:hypothetical protein CDAR_459081 [Caerostris darwini]